MQFSAFALKYLFDFHIKPFISLKKFVSTFGLGRGNCPHCPPPGYAPGQWPNFVFRKYLRAQLKDKIQSAFVFEQLVDNHLRINVTSRLFVKKANPSDGFAQASN